MILKKQLLLIEDEEDIASLIELQAEMAGYQTTVCTNGTDGCKAAEKMLPDLILIDVMLPAESGLDVCRKLKTLGKTNHIPIIIVSAKGDEFDIVLGLELGADDYVCKPFSPKVLFSRIKAVLRRGQHQEFRTNMVKFGEFALDIEHYLLRKSDKTIQLTLSEFGILKKLVTNQGKVLTRNQLLDDVKHDEEPSIVDRNIDVHIASLRKKLGPTFPWIETVRGVGYRFREENDTIQITP